jgi:putative ABC transport system permease protein
MVILIMSVGAVFGAMNTMYAAVGSRSREIATLRSLGFRRRAILLSFMVESIILAALGGILGCLLALPLNGLTTSTINWDTFSELAFAFRVTPGTLAAGMTFGIVMGAIGGLFPAIRAARTPITVALRQT